MGSPTKACVPARQDSFRLPPSSTPQTQWLRVQDQRRPRRVAPTFLLSSPRGKSRSSRKLSVSWTQTKTVFCLPQTLSLPSTLSANPSPMVRPKACSQKPPDPSTSHRWLCFSQRRWPEVLMMMTPSSRLSMPSKSTAKSTQMFKHSLMTFGDKFSASEVDNAFGEFLIEDGMIDAVHLKGLMVSKKEEEAE